MKVVIIKPIKVSEISRTTVLPISTTEYDISDSGGEVLVRLGFAKEVKPIKKEPKQVVKRTKK